MKLLHIGFSNSVSLDKIVAIISPDSAVAKRIRDSAREGDALIDCTMGRKLRSMILTNGTYIFTSTMRPEALLQRIETSKTKQTLESSLPEIIEED